MTKVDELMKLIEATIKLYSYHATDNLMIVDECKAINAVRAALDAALTSGGDEVTAALCDLQYIAGMKAGWNFAIEDDNIGYKQALSGRADAMRVLKSRRTSTPPSQTPPPRFDELAKKHDELVNALRPLITKRMGAEKIREGIQRAIASAAIAKAEGGAA